MAGLIMFIRFLRPERLVREASDEILLQFLESLKTPDLPFLPSTWAAKALLAGVGTLSGGALPHVLLLWGGASLIFLLTVWVASQVYYTGWAGGHAAYRVAAPRRTWRVERLLAPLLRHCSATTRGLLIKDLKLFFRDPAQWSQLLLLGALAVIYLYNIQNLPLQHAVSAKSHFRAESRPGRFCPRRRSGTVCLYQHQPGRAELLDYSGGPHRLSQLSLGKIHDVRAALGRACRNAGGGVQSAVTGRHLYYAVSPWWSSC